MTTIILMSSAELLLLLMESRKGDMRETGRVRES